MDYFYLSITQRVQVNSTISEDKIGLWDSQRISFGTNPFYSTYEKLAKNCSSIQVTMYADKIALILKKISKLLSYEVNLDLSHRVED